MPKHSNKPTVAKNATARYERQQRQSATAVHVATERFDVMELFIGQNREEHTKIMETLTRLDVSIARVEERLSADKLKWGLIATVMTSTAVVFLTSWIKRLWSL